MGKFKLVNPVIVGSFETTFETETPIKAAQQFWKALTEDDKTIINNVPRFMFTLKNEDTEELHHFMVEEKPIEGNKTVDFTIKVVDLNIPSKKLSRFKTKVKRAKDEATKIIKTQQEGGKHKKRYDDKDDDSSSSSSSDYIYSLKHLLTFRDFTQPILYWWYYPEIYTITDQVFIPSFNFKVAPYVSISI